MAEAPRQADNVARRGIMLVLSSPSGAGKTTLSRRLLETDPRVELSVSVTTRPKRSGEVDGRDYHFIDQALFDVDWQGTQQLRDHAAADLVSVFVLPPSVTELERRLKARAQDSDDVIRGRMSKASGEMSHWAEYDYVIINRDIVRAFDDMCAILSAERLKRARQTGLSDFVRALQAGL